MIWKIITLIQAIAWFFFFYLNFCYVKIISSSQSPHLIVSQFKSTTPKIKISTMIWTHQSIAASEKSSCLRAHRAAHMYTDVFNWHINSISNPNITYSHVCNCKRRKEKKSRTPEITQLKQLIFSFFFISFLIFIRCYHFVLSFLFETPLTSAF